MNNHMKNSAATCGRSKALDEYKCPLIALLTFLILSSSYSVEAQFTYTTNADNSLTITGYTGSGGAVAIPTNIEGLRVTGIGLWAFNGNANVTSVTIPGTVTSVGFASFQGCSMLCNVTFPDSLTYIADYMFNGCPNLTNAPIPPSVTSIGEQAFNDTGFVTITIPTNVSSIGADAFSECTALAKATLCGITTLPEGAFLDCASLVSVTLPDTVTDIIGNPFGNCPSLTEVFFQGNFPSQLTGEADEGVVFSDNPNVKVYYLIGTSNWTFCTLATGITPVLWNPLIQATNGNFGVQNNQFGFDITGTTNIPIVVQASTNPANPVWTSLTNVTLTNGLFHFSEPAQPNSPARYYRIASP
jgi:hypothetical protein